MKYRGVCALFRFRKQKVQTPGVPLWDKNFTILTLGSIISYMGSAVIIFVLRLLVLDFTGFL